MPDEEKVVIAVLGPSTPAAVQASTSLPDVEYSRCARRNCSTRLCHSDANPARSRNSGRSGAPATVAAISAPSEVNMSRQPSLAYS